MPDTTNTTNTIYTTAKVKVALVTGGSRGLGRSTVLSLAERDVRCIFTYHENHAEADKVVAAVAEKGGRAIALPLDVSRSSTFDGFILAVRTALGELGSDRVDFLVNNAGTAHHKPIAQTTEAELDALYNVHFKGVFFLTQKMLPLLRDGGRIVNLSSGLTRVALSNSGPYASMKGAIEVFTRYLAKELGSRGIAANAVAPGAIQTDFSGGLVRDNPEVNQFVSSVTALGRPGVPDDIGPMIASLLSEDNRWINGQRIEASGGMSL